MSRASLVSFWFFSTAVFSLELAALRFFYIEMAAGLQNAVVWEWGRCLLHKLFSARDFATVGSIA